MKTDYRRIYSGVFSPILSSVITVFGLTAGSYCFSRLQPDIYTCNLCLSFSDLRFLDASEGLFSAKTPACVRYKVNSSLGCECDSGSTA